MGGKKRKILIAKRESENPRRVTFSKRRQGLYSKASELCLLSGAQLAILATPVSAGSHVSFYSFGHSSVDSVVSAFLSDQNPNCENVNPVASKKGFWWEDESLSKSESSKELSDSVDAISSMLKSLKGLKKKKEEEEDKKLGHNQTLESQQATSSASHSDLIAFTADNNNNDHEETGLLGDLYNEEYTLDGILDLCF